MKFSGYDYGLSPAILAMADVEGLNIISKTMLGAAQLFVDPPLNVPSDLVGKVQWRPRGINPYDKENMFVRPAQITGQYPIGSDREQRIESSIRERFHVDTFLMLTQQMGGQRTAYEVSEMMGEKAAILGAELAPLNNQMDAILDLIYYLKASTKPQNGGTINPMPDILRQLSVKGDAFSPVYLGPLAQAQRRLYKTQGLRGALEAVAPVVQASPDAARVINFEKATRIILDSYNFPQEAIYSEEDVKALKEKEAQQLAMMQQEDMIMKVMQGVKTASEADKNTGNALTQNVMAAVKNQAANGGGGVQQIQQMLGGGGAGGAGAEGMQQIQKLLSGGGMNAPS